jgi:pimeloyl-ACP methyl ester carboxylesterase
LTIHTARKPIAPPIDRYVDVGNVKTRYWCEGNGSSTIVIVHGFGVAMEHWKECFIALARTHRVYAMDLVGFGKTEKPDVQYSIAYLADFVVEFVKTQRVDQAVFVGHSMGGAVVMQLALSHPDLVSKLVLVSSAGLGVDASLGMRLLTLPYVGEIFVRPNRWLLQVFFRDAVYHQDRFPEELVDVYVDMLALPHAREMRLKILRALASWRGPREWIIPMLADLRTLEVPTLILWGKQDNVLPVKNAYEASKKLPNARLHVFDACGHNPQMEYVDDVRRMIAEFV